MYDNNRRQDFTSLYQYFGLYEIETQTPLPLTRVTVNATLNEYLAEITYSQTYDNKNDFRIETEYFFPISNNACFHGFKAYVGWTTIVGVIKEKSEANRVYKERRDAGDLVAYAEILEEDYSIMCVKIGNIPPNTKVDIEFSYIERVEISLNKFWRFTLPSCIVSHDVSLDKRGQERLVNLVDNYARIVAASYRTYEPMLWEVYIVINSKAPFTFLQSSSHQIKMQTSEMGNSFIAKVALHPDMYYQPTQDFVLLYATQHLNTPHYLLTPFDKGYCALVSFFPSTNFLSFDDAFRASLEGRDPLQNFISTAAREYIFVIDQNLDTWQLNLAKMSLEHFIKSLSENSSFNILFLGATAELFAEKSVLRSKKTFQSATKKLQGLKPMIQSETQVQKMFQHLEKLTPTFSANRVVFFLTNGKVNIPVSDFCRSIKERLFKTRFFALGIGEGSITEHIQRGTMAGYGSCELLRSQQEIPQKVTFLLQSASTPSFTDFDLKISDEASLVMDIIPLPKTLGCISPNELVEFLVIFNKKLAEKRTTEMVLSFYNEFNQRQEMYKSVISVDSADYSEAVLKVGMHKVCQGLQIQKDTYEAMQSEFGQRVKNDYQKKLVITSLAYGILTKQTAFVCVINEGNDVIRQIPTQKIVIANKRLPMTATTTQEKKQEFMIDYNTYGYGYGTERTRFQDTVRRKGENIWQGFEPIRTLHSFEDDIIESGGVTPSQSEGRGKKNTLPSNLRVMSHNTLRITVDTEELDFNHIMTPIVTEHSDNVGLTSNIVKVQTLPTETTTTFKKDSKTAKFVAWFKDVMKCNLKKKKKTVFMFYSTSFFHDWDFVYKLFALQDKKGYWEANPSTLGLLQLELNSLKKEIPQALLQNGERESIWLTCLIIIGFEHYAQSDISSKYQSDYQEALEWLKFTDSSHQDYLRKARTYAITH